MIFIVSNCITPDVRQCNVLTTLFTNFGDRSCATVNKLKPGYQLRLRLTSKCFMLLCTFLDPS
jgi:hypothetical protein